MRFQSGLLLNTLLIALPLTKALAGEPGKGSDLLVRQAQECARVNERLERLRCFDRVFHTPVEEAQVGEPQKFMPHAWQRAMASAAKADSDNLMNLNYQGEEDATEGDAWLTLTASNSKTQFKDEAKPVLMMSCIDRLSRIELFLPGELADARVKISLVGGSTQYWRSDDSGYVLSSGRGMPAIEMMKKMSTERRSVFRSNSKFIDGLTFNTESLPSALKVLRQRCRW